jgi:thiamine pyrophosphokinase
MEKQGTCYIFGAGSYYGLCSRPVDGDFVIAADGGMRICRQAGINPDLVVGDFDSLGSEPSGVDVVRFPVEKDDTDTMLAIKLGLERGYRRFHIYGGTGGRLDHTLANLQSLIYADEHGARAFLFDDGFVYTAITDGEISISGPEDGIFSVFCLSGSAQGVTIAGGKYPLSDYELTSAFPLGVSNHFLDGEVKISVRRGALVIGWQNGCENGKSCVYS